MQAVALAGHAPTAIDLNQPGSYLTWNVFTISVANLVLIAVMVAIFGAALLLPFPRGRGEDTAVPDPVPDPGIAPGDERMWTARARRRALSMLPPGKLLPDRQPAYVASWVYVFGVASLAALGVAIVSGFAIALGGTDWWHTNPVGHFFTSLHLWSVELFMALIVIHLWGKFWMAAWRGRRAMTWITGVVAFGACVVECFTGYLSQQNFDSQWIATNGKDAFNAVGVGAFFQRGELRPDAALAHRADPDHPGRAGRCARAAGPDARCQPPAAEPAGALARPGRPQGGQGSGRCCVARPDAQVRHPQGGHDRGGDHDRPGISDGRAAVLAQRAAGERQSWAKVAPADFLATAAGELSGTAL